jgi:hypothetical protein
LLLNQDCHAGKNILQIIAFLLIEMQRDTRMISITV